MDIKELIKNKAELINSELKEYINPKDIPQKDIYDAMAYSLNAGGKRLRPVIMLLVCDMLKGDTKDVLPFACAMEMIHTYSLIHDDLPSMDNDDLRRGKPTNHKVFGEAMAILAGDALLNMAFEITSSHQYKNTKNALKAISVLANSSGALGMIGGQVIDIQSENKKISEDLLLQLHTLKTGAIIRSSGVIGAIMSNASSNEIDAIDTYCKNLGIAFQIQDDILDVIGDEAALGKPIGSDSDNEKTTFVTLFGLDGAKEKVLEYSNKATDALKIFGEKGKNLSQLCLYLIDRKYWYFIVKII